MDISFIKTKEVYYHVWIERDSLHYWQDKIEAYTLTKRVRQLSSKMRFWE